MEQEEFDVRGVSVVNLPTLRARVVERLKHEARTRPSSRIIFLGPSWSNEDDFCTVRRRPRESKLESSRV
eukprot:13770441-Heterocapsa_arctica.AAC.1